jgi:hypothetical protein
MSISKSGFSISIFVINSIAASLSSSA